ncbi:unnamed protein product [Enterobius vermicularis]|uniref:Coiled-coil domain-containing protein 149 n=1 Tax=Enterobius vermicularis TaxID=51028 RepID=A0A158QB93_ENTVE|nr:unnamed protein product [Enterobius vermicularis]
MEAVYLPNSQADFQTQLTIIDKRLERARKKRDEYLKLLKNKYPQWTSMELQTRRQQYPKYYQPTLLLDKLETAKYHWDSQNLDKRRKVPLPQLEPYSSIPNSGPLLGNEIAAIKRRLNRIAEDLRDLRSHRLHLSSAEFYATLETPNTLLAKHDGNAERTDGFSTLRKLIERIDCEAEVPVEEPNSDDLATIKIEELLKKYKDVTENPSFINSESPKSPEVKNEQPASSYQKLLSMIKNENGPDSSDNDDFDPSFAQSTPIPSNPSNKPKNTNEKQSKTATDGQQSDFRMNFLGAAQLSDSTDSDSDTPKGLAMNVTCNDNLDSDSDFFG